MRQQTQAGKITFTTILFLIVIFYGGFAAVKVISANLTKSQIKNEIIDKLGFARGDDFTPEQGEKIVRDILKAHGVIRPGDKYNFEYEDENGETASTGEEEGREGLKPPEIFVELNKKAAKIKFFVEYEYEVNLLLFKYRKIYTIDDEMRNYN